MENLYLYQYVMFLFAFLFCVVCLSALRGDHFDGEARITQLAMTIPLLLVTGWMVSLWSTLPEDLASLRELPTWQWLYNVMTPIAILVTAGYIFALVRQRHKYGSEFF